MRSLNLVFKLRPPVALSHPEAAAEKSTAASKSTSSAKAAAEPAPSPAALFRDANRLEYQPFFALLERNIQKLPKLHLTLDISPDWVAAMLKWDPALFDRLTRLVKTDQIELLSPDPDKLSEYGLAASSSTVIKKEPASLSPHISPNQVFETPAPIRRFLLANHKFSTAIMEAQPLPLAEEQKPVENFASEAPAPKEPHKARPAAIDFVRAMYGQNDAKSSASRRSGGTKAPTYPATRQVFSAKKLLKELELESLRAPLITIVLDTSIFPKFREQGIIRCFDEFFTAWLKLPGSRFTTTSGTLELGEPMVLMPRATGATPAVSPFGTHLPAKIPRPSNTTDREDNAKKDIEEIPFTIKFRHSEPMSGEVIEETPWLEDLWDDLEEDSPSDLDEAELEIQALAKRFSEKQAEAANPDVLDDAEIIAG